MDMNTLSQVQFGKASSLAGFIFENGQQHKTFAETLADSGILIPRYPLFDANPNDLEDWLLCHQQEHVGMANALGLSNPINLLDADWNNESSFYDWISTHLSIHQQIQAALGL